MPQRTASSPLGVLALVGGSEWTDGAQSLDRALLDAAGTSEVLVLPTAAAFEQPQAAIATATKWFATLGATVRPVMALTRDDAKDENICAPVRDAALIYLSGGSPLHLKQVLKDTPLWDALIAAWHRGATLVGSSAGAMVLGDPMVDPRGGTLTVGLGVVHDIAVVPHADTWSLEKLRRTIGKAKPPVKVAAIDERTALVRSSDGAWVSLGAGRVRVYNAGSEVGLADLP